MLRGPFARAAPDGLPNADVIMERGVLLPLSHAIDDATLDFVLTTLEEFLAGCSDRRRHSSRSICR